MSDGGKGSMAGGTGMVLAAYALWGVLPIYWKALGHLPSGAILAHRIIWALATTSLLLTVGRQWRATGEALLSRATLGPLVLSALLISLNWWLYIWAVNHERIVEASFGYYINPLVSVALGVMVQKERLARPQILAFGLASVGVLIMGFGLGRVPLVSLTLSLSFGLYGLLKKRAAIPALTGLQLETLFSVPLALILLLPHPMPWGVAAPSPGTLWLLILAGPATAIPLWLFGAGARRITMVRLGFAQYLSPTISLLIGVFLYHEPLGAVKTAAFACIWAALGVFMTAEVMKRKALAQAREARAG